MIIALDSHGNRVSSAMATKSESYICPCCNEFVTLCKGAIKRPYFSHKRGSDCVLDSGDMCEWHIRMQEHFSEEYREVIFKENGKVVHRADICKDGYIIEFQHSSISLFDFDKRNRYYTKKGYKVIWVFDTSDWFKSGRIKSLNYEEDGRFKVSRPRDLWKCILKDDNISICFCEYNDYDSIDYVYNVFWHNLDFTRVMMDVMFDYTVLSDDTDLAKLFKSPEDKREEILAGKSYDKVYRGIRGFRKASYMCKGTDTWANNCVSCENCILLENKDTGSIAYCNKEGTLSINFNHYVPQLFISD